MCARHPRGFRRLARFAPRVSEVLPGLRGPVYAHRLFACRTRIMAESPCQGKTDSTYGLINNATALVSPDRHLSQLAFELHTFRGSGRGIVTQQGCEGTPVAPVGWRSVR